MLQSIAEYFRVLQSISEYYRVLQSITEHYKALQSITEYWTNFLGLLLLKHDDDNDDCDEDEKKMLNSGCSCQEKYFLHNAVDLQPWRRTGGEINMRKQSTRYTTATNIYIFLQK